MRGEAYRPDRAALLWAGGLQAGDLVVDEAGGQRVQAMHGGQEKGWDPMSARDARRRKAADLVRWRHSHRQAARICARTREAWPRLHSSFWQRRLQSLAVFCYLGDSQRGGQVNEGAGR